MLNDDGQLACFLIKGSTLDTCKIHISTFTWDPACTIELRAFRHRHNDVDVNDKIESTLLAGEWINVKLKSTAQLD